MSLSPIHLSILHDSLVLAGHDGAALLALAGLTRAQLDPMAPWLDEACLDRLMCAAVELTGDPGWALAAAGSSALTRYGPHAVVVGQAPTLRHALHDMLTFAPLIMSRPELRIDEAAGVATMHITPFTTTPEGHRCRTEYVAALTVLQSRRAGSRPEDFIELGFVHPEPGHVDRYHALFGTRLKFNQPSAWVTFPASLLDAPLMGHDRLVYEALRAPLQAFMDQRLRDLDPLHAMRQAVREALPKVPEAAALARQLGCSERTLRRQLAGKGLSLGELVQQCQREAAEKLLREGRLSLKQIADETGFSSASCFHRAFRRWHGQTPSDWRDATSH
ncbi:MAG: hypothetical protein RI907_2629 [Pseudomonadota bacterium]|jgi:AraC-like DNA-binding protein